MGDLRVEIQRYVFAYKQELETRRKLKKSKDDLDDAINKELHIFVGSTEYISPAMAEREKTLNLIVGRPVKVVGFKVDIGLHKIMIRLNPSFGFNLPDRTFDASPEDVHDGRRLHYFGNIKGKSMGQQE